MTWTWLSRAAVEAIHVEQLAEHGGLPGLRDANALEAALARPKNKAAYGEPDVAELAAAYLFGIARNHPFSDGNKRTALLAAFAFLDTHGWELTADNDAVYTFVMGVAAGRIGEDGAARLFRDHIRPAGAPPAP